MPCPDVQADVLRSLAAMLERLAPKHKKQNDPLRVNGELACSCCHPTGPAWGRLVAVPPTLRAPGAASSSMPASAAGAASKTEQVTVCVAVTRLAHQLHQLCASVYAWVEVHGASATPPAALQQQHQQLQGEVREGLTTGCPPHPAPSSHGNGAAASGYAPDSLLAVLLQQLVMPAEGDAAAGKSSLLGLLLQYTLLCASSLGYSDMGGIPNTPFAGTTAWTKPLCPQVRAHPLRLTTLVPPKWIMTCRMTLCCVRHAQP